MIRILVFAMAVFAWALPASADTFTSEKFLTWSRESQTSYFRSSVGMAGIIVAQLDSDKAKCITGWYADQDRTGHPALFAALRNYPDFHPQVMILWAIQKECGKFLASR